MAALTKDDIKAAIRELVPGMIHKAIHETVPPIVNNIVSQETGSLKSMISAQNMTLQAIQIDVGQLKRLAREQGVLYEDLNDRLKADSELLRSNLNVKDQVDDHERRIGGVESTQTILKDAIKEHSKQLKTRLN